MRRTFSLSRLHWPPHGGALRVFIEDADQARYQLLARAFSQAGYEVGPFCGGVHFHEAVFDQIKPPVCPVLKSGACGLLEQADVIVYRFGLESPSNRTILDRIRTKYPSTPVVLEASQPDEHAADAQGFVVIAAPASVDQLLDAVSSVVGDPGPPDSAEEEPMRPSYT